MHEGIFSKANVQGWPKEWRGQINIEANCILLCDNCNLGLAGKSPPARLEVLEQQVAYYGLGVLRWARSLPFTVNPLRGALGGSM